MRGRILPYYRIAGSMVLACCLLAAACTRHVPAESQASRGSPGSPGSTDDRPAIAIAVSRYGGGPIRRPDIVYKPDVVLIEAGPTAIRAVGSDHLTYSMDRRAKGVEELALGSVMYAASMVVGRVVKLSVHDDLAEVTLAPVQITEIFQAAKLHLDLPIGTTTTPAGDQRVASSVRIISTRPRLGAATLAARPFSVGTGFLPVRFDDPSADAPPPQSDCDSSGCGSAPSANPPCNSADCTPDTPPPPPAPPCNSPGCDKSKPGSESTGGALKFSWRDWEVALAFKAKSNAQKGSSGSELGLKLQRSPKSKTVGLKYGVQIRLIGEDIHLKMDQTIAGGQLDNSHGTVSLEGVQRIEVGVFGGSAGGNTDNIKERFDFPVKIPPVQLYLGVPPDAIPVVLQFSLKFFAETAFSAPNSTLWGKGIYSVQGALGFAAGVPIAPTITAIQPIVRNLSGVLLAPGGMLFGGELRVLIGLGLKDVAYGGPYSKWRFSVGVTRGSDLSIYRELNCRNVTYKLEGGVGLALANDSQVPDDPLKKVDMEFVERMVSIWEPGTSVYPSPERCSFKNTPLPGVT